MKRFALPVLSILFFASLACGQVADPNAWKLLDESDYSIRYPGDWDLDRSGMMGTTFFLFSKPSSGIDKFRENVNLVIQDLTGMGIDLDKYVEISEEQISTGMIVNGHILESERLSAGGAPFQRLVYTGDQEPFNLKFEQYYWIKDEKAYVLTLTCESNQFDYYRQIGEKILNSFRFK